MYTVPVGNFATLQSISVTSSPRRKHWRTNQRSHPYKNTAPAIMCPAYTATPHRTHVQNPGKIWTGTSIGSKSNSTNTPAERAPWPAGSAVLQAVPFLEDRTPKVCAGLIPNSSMTVGFQSLGPGVVPPPTAEPKIRNRNPGPWNPGTWNPGTLQP